MDGRVCKKCGTWKPRSEFHVHALCKDGINTVCKDCRKTVSKQQWKEIEYVKKMYQRAKSRAKRKNREFTIKLEDLSIPEKCPIFGVPLIENTPYAPSIDRIDSNKGYIPDNIQIISQRANLLKNNATVKELEMVVDFLKNKELQ